MGFGYIFYGLMMLLEVGVSVNSEYMIGLDIFPDVAGYLFMLAAARRLKDYSQYFEKMLITLIPIIVLSSGVLVFQVMGAFGIEASFVALMLENADYIIFPIRMLMLVFMFSGIRYLAEDVDMPKIARRATVAIWLCAASHITDVLVKLEGTSGVFKMSAAALSILSMISVLLWYVFIIYSMYEVFSCYMYICREGDEDMNRRKIFNPLEKLLESFQKNRQK